MPNIEVPKVDRTLGFELSDRAASSSALAGRRIAQNYNEAASAYGQFGQELGSAVKAAGDAVVKYEEHKEISKGAVGFAKLQLGLTNEWNDRAKQAADRDPNDPSVGPEFHEKIMEPALQRYVDAFHTEGGRQWAEHHIEALRTHMYEKTRADMSSLAGHAAVVNQVQTVNAFSTAVMQDPTSLKATMKMYGSTMDALVSSNPNFTAVQAAKFKEEMTQKGMEAIVKSGVFGAIQKNWVAGMKLAEDPELAQYLKPMEVKQFQDYAKQQQRMDDYERRNDRIAKKQEAEDKADESMRNLLPRLYSDKPDVTRDQLNALLENGEITPRVYQYLGNIMENPPGDKLPAGVAERSAVDLITKVHKGEITSMEPIYKALAEHTIDYPRFKQVQQEFANFKSDDGTPLSQMRNVFIRDFSHIVNPPDINNQRWYPGREVALYSAIRRQEKLAREGAKDPSAAYDPNSPFYIGKTPEAQPISPFDIRRDEQQRTQERQAKTPPKPDWLGEYKDEAKWDSAGYWFVLRDGKKQRVRE